MLRTNVINAETGKLAGWFDYHAAEKWSDRDHDSRGCGGVGRGESVLRTASGRWVLEHWSMWREEDSSWGFISADDAKEWLLRNNFDDAVETHFGSPPPEVDLGGPPVTVGGSKRLIQAPDELWAAVDARAGALGVSGSEVVRQVLRESLL